MRLANSRFMRQIAGCLVLLAVLQAAEATAQSSQKSPTAERVSIPNSAEAGTPNADGQQANANNAAQPAPDPNVNGEQQGQSQAGAGENGSAESNSGQQQSTPAKPVGTAAAPAVNSTGVAGSRPTGAVIAPAKQRRVRSILIRVGVVVGACVAIGTVVALSHSSPSQPR
jgi:cell division protein FtsN